MLVVKKLTESIFPVDEIPSDKAVVEKLEIYFTKKEKKKSKDISGIVVLGILVIIIDFYFWTQNSIATISKLLLIFTPSILFLRGIYLLFCYKREENCELAIKQKDKAAILALLSLLFALGSAALSFFATSKTMIISDNNIFCIIVIGQIFYVTSYLIGYRLNYKRVVEAVLKKSKNPSENDDKINKETIRKGGIYGLIGYGIAIMTYEYRIIPEVFTCFGTCVLLGRGIFFVSPIWAECKFSYQLYKD